MLRFFFGWTIIDEGTCNNDNGDMKMTNIVFRWTDGKNKDFQKFYLKTEEYYSAIVGGEENRKAFIPHNISEAITDVLIAYDNDKAIACAGIKGYSSTDAEVKRVWVEPEYRGRHLGQEIMRMIEEKAAERGFKRAILQTRELMTDAVRLYQKMGYSRIENYAPYDKLSGAICFAKELY